MSTPAGLPVLVRDVARSTRGHDLALYAGGVTFFAAVGAVPLLLLAVFLAGQIVGQHTVRELCDQLARLLPAGMGARTAARALADSGSRLGPVSALAALVPASLYGEGLVRAFDRLSVRGDRGLRTLRGRLGSLVLVALSPVLLLAGLAATSGLSGGTLGRGTAARLLGVYCAFLVGWLTISPLLALAYRGLAPERPCGRALAWGALGTGSIVSGTSLGWVLFMTLDLPLGRAYGGSTALAVAAVCGLWLYLLHILVLVGYVATLRLAARQGHPLGPVVERTAVRTARHSDNGPAVAA